ncbi:TonB-dependent receptor [Desulfobacterales bacterium HSG2]|nr:TonB-dependent receptor [Desulfobacterales bacterium HSG2]
MLRLFYEEKDLEILTPTRHPKHISEAAENISVVTAEEIDAMNAHTVAEVLNRVPGLFLSSFAHDFCSNAVTKIQASKDIHVLFLLDGMPWNFLSGGGAMFNAIPVGIIERIEIIRGPASSAWGSSLGGVVSIITKSAGNTGTGRPAGAVQASYGEGESQDYRAGISGKAGSAGYFLFAGHQESDGLLFSRDYENDSLFSKFSLPLSRDVNVGMSMGYSDPRFSYGDIPNYDRTISAVERAVFVTGTVDARLTRTLGLAFSLYAFKQKYSQTHLLKGDDVSPPELFLDEVYDEQTTGGSGKLVWEQGINTVVFGLDYKDGDVDQTICSGSLYQSFGAPKIARTSSDVTSWAIYLNDTISVNRWSFTPGIRYDYNDIDGSFVSPSLGITYRLGETSVLRASAARGFTTPPLAMTAGGAVFLDPNPDLESEEVWSYQAGMETSSIPYIWMKAAVFYHDLENALYRMLYTEREPPDINDITVNKEENVRRWGIEMEAETLPFHNLSISAGFSYVYVDYEDIDDEKKHTWNIGIRYDDKDTLNAELFGHYVWWNDHISQLSDYKDFIWDMNLNKTFYSKEDMTMEFFITVHNLFNGDQYVSGLYQNPDRWVEGGIKFDF